MEFFGWLFFSYIVVAFGCWMRFGRQFLFAKDIRRPRNSDVWDAFPPMIGIVLIGFTLMVMNPSRFVRAAGKSVLWPVTLYRWFQRRGATSTGSASVTPDVTAPEWSPEPLGRTSAGPRAPPSEEPMSPPASAPAPIATPERFAGKSLVAPPSLPGAPVPRASSGPLSGRHVVGPTAGDVAPRPGRSAAAAPVRGRSALGGSAASPRPAWGAAPPPRWAAPPVTEQLGQPIARPATHVPSRHRPPSDH